MSTFGPSFPGFPVGPLTPGSPCVNNKSPVIRYITPQERFRLLYCGEQSVPSAAPFLPPSLRLLARPASPSPPSVPEARGPWSGTRCRHSVSTGEREEAKAVAQLRFHQDEVERRVSALYYVTSPGWRTPP